MSAAINVDLSKHQYLTPHLVRELDEAIAAAVRSVDDGEERAAIVTFSVSAAWTKDGEKQVGFTIKSATTVKGSMSAAGLGQFSLGLEG